MQQPTLTTERLILRPYSMDDAKELQKLIGNRGISDTMHSVPHPYTVGMAEEWISKRQAMFDEGKSAQFLVTDKLNGFLIGGIGLTIYKDDENAELGYWIGTPHWHKGYCSESALAVIKYGLEELALKRICAKHMTRNPRSGKVMQKIGMQHEGHLRQAWKKRDKFEDVEMYAIIRSDFIH
jgi:RimJ/RimL family protein N-acetyltransferase